MPGIYFRVEIFNDFPDFYKRPMNCQDASKTNYSDELFYDYVKVLETCTCFCHPYCILSNYFENSAGHEFNYKQSIIISSCAAFIHTDGTYRQDELRKQASLNRRTTQIVRLDG